MRINIKPLSINVCWQGKRFKTKEYSLYEKELLWILPKINLPEAPYEIYFKFYFSNSGSDLDNPCKPLLDIMQKKYGFNDKLVYKLTIEKELVKKGKEGFEFFILEYEPTQINK